MNPKGWLVTVPGDVKETCRRGTKECGLVGKHWLAVDGWLDDLGGLHQTWQLYDSVDAFLDKLFSGTCLSGG